MSNEVAVGSFYVMLMKVTHNRIKLCYADVILMFPLYELPVSQAHVEAIDEAEFLERLAWCGWRLVTPLRDSMKASPDSFSIVIERAEPATMPTLEEEVEWCLRTPAADAPQQLREGNVLEIDIDYPEPGTLGWIYVTFTLDRGSHVVTVSEFNDPYFGIANLLFCFMDSGARGEITIDEEGNDKDTILRPVQGGYARLIVKDHDYGETALDDHVRITYIDIEVEERRLVNTFMAALRSSSTRNTTHVAGERRIFIRIS